MRVSVKCGVWDLHLYVFEVWKDLNVTFNCAYLI